MFIILDIENINSFFMDVRLEKVGLICLVNLLKDKFL